MGQIPGKKHESHKRGEAHGNSVFKPEYCEQVIELGKQGKSAAQMASHFGICRFTIDKWAADIPEFGEAYAIARAHCQAWWEDAGQSGMYLEKFNAAVWKKSVESRFKDDYTERQELKHEGGFVLQFDPEDEDA